VLEGADLHEQIREMVDEVVAGYVAGATSEGYPEEWDLDKLWRAFRQLFPISISVDDVVEEAGGERAGLSGEFITEAALADAQASYERREEEFGSEVMRELERRVVLSVLDRKWREHLYEMDYLREGIGLRGYGQRDPLVEYQREGYDMFGAMMEGIKEESVGNLFNLQVQVQENPIVEEAAPNGAASPGSPEAPAVDTPEAASRPATPGPGVPGPRPGGRTGGAPARPAPARSAARPAPAKPTPAKPAPAKPAADQTPAIPAGLAPRRTQRLEYSAPSVDGGTHVETSRTSAAGAEYSRVGRNDPCPCGSGRKYKRCHGDPRNTP
jgi:preprotein translocase subunit SecA